MWAGSTNSVLRHRAIEEQFKQRSNAKLKKDDEVEVYVRHRLSNSVNGDVPGNDGDIDDDDGKWFGAAKVIPGSPVSHKSPKKFMYRSATVVGVRRDCVQFRFCSQNVGKATYKTTKNHVVLGPGAPGARPGGCWQLQNHLSLGPPPTT